MAVLPVSTTDIWASSHPQSGPMTASLPVWGWFGRTLLMIIGSLLIIPAPWVGTSYYRALGTSLSLPDGRRLTFSGKAGDIWLVFVGIAIFGWLGRLPYAAFITLPLTWALTVVMMRWFCAKLGTEDGTLRLAFTGGTWNYIGWSLLLMVSFISIIGWAWVLRYMTRWICDNMTGTVQFEFQATGWELLWRTLALVFGGLLVIPIPWLLRWYTVWFVSQFYVTPISSQPR